MRIGVWNGLTTAMLAVTIAFIVKDLTVPLAGLALFGLVDRLVAAPRPGAGLER